MSGKASKKGRLQGSKVNRSRWHNRQLFLVSVVPKWIYSGGSRDRLRTAPVSSTQNQVTGKTMYTGLYRSGQHIHGSEGYTRYFIQGDFIYGPKGNTKYYVSNGHVFGPKGYTHYFFSDDHLCGPSKNVPWISRVTNGRTGARTT